MSKVDVKVLVTGGTGFISSWVIKLLLEEGYSVRATIRDPKSSKADFLKELPGSSERLELVAADLYSSEGWAEAVAGCTYVHHIASPYSLKVRDPQKDLVDPAVNGTLHVLRACKGCPEVKRVVLTSSVAAVSDCFDEWKTHVYGPDDWNTTSSLKRNPYFYSKVLAEKAALEFMKMETPSFTLSVINPYVVIGPALDLKAKVNQSVELIYGLLQGKYPLNPPLIMGVVDVRDVALGHVKAMEVEEAAGKRFVMWSGNVPLYEVATITKEVAPPKVKRRISSRPPPPFLTKGLIVGLARLTESKDTATFISSTWGKAPKFDVSLSESILGLKYRDPRESVKETAEWCVKYTKY